MNEETTTEPTPNIYGTERKTLRAWLDENPEVPEGLTSEICPLKSLVKFACTIGGVDAGSAGYAQKITYDELLALALKAKQTHREILAKANITEEHKAPIIPADSLYCALVIQRPSSGQIDAIHSAVLEGATSMGQDQRAGLRTSMLTQMLQKCALYPDAGQRQKLFVDYGGLQQEFTNKCMMLGHKAVEEIVGK